MLFLLEFKTYNLALIKVICYSTNVSYKKVLIGIIGISGSLNIQISFQKSFKCAKCVVIGLFFLVHFVIHRTIVHAD